MTRYQEAIDWLYGLQFFGVKLGLEVMEQLAAELPIPGGGQQIIHVAGTNGKGSVCAMMEAVSRAAGHRTGLFTSPHLVSYCERLRLRGEMIPEAEVAERIFALRERVAHFERHPTFFEFTTALALEYFRDSEAEVVFLETGLGGRLDATNFVDPTACAIAQIGLDHCQWLGETHGEVAAEKAGIIKEGVPVVSAPQHPEAEAVLRTVAKERNAPFKIVESKLDDVAIGLSGEHQKWNAALAVATLHAGGISVTREEVEEGLASVQWPARFQVLEGGKLIVDGAHNPAAGKALAETWRGQFANEKAVVVFGAASGKDFRGVWREVEGIAENLIVTPFDSPRALQVDELRAALPDAESALDVPGALSRAREISVASGCRVLVTGSLFLAGEVLGLLDGRTYEASDQ